MNRYVFRCALLIDTSAPFPEERSTPSLDRDIFCGVIGAVHRTAQVWLLGTVKRTNWVLSGGDTVHEKCGSHGGWSACRRPCGSRRVDRAARFVVRRKVNPSLGQRSRFRPLTGRSPSGRLLSGAEDNRRSRNSIQEKV
ncbi:hypothetical protein MRX96_005345 [Rhipicephalus microplus]